MVLGCFSIVPEEVHSADALLNIHSTHLINISHELGPEDIETTEAQSLFQGPNRLPTALNSAELSAGTTWN